RRRETMLGALLMFAGVWLGVVYAMHLPVEHYVVALAALAVVYGVMGWAAEDRRLAEQAAQDFRGVAENAAVLASLAVVAVGTIVVVAAADTDSPRHFVVHTRWFITPSAALVLAFCGLDAWRSRRTGAVLAGAVTFVALGASVVYGLDVRMQFYALALIAPAILLAV